MNSHTIDSPNNTPRTRYVCVTIPTPLADYLREHRPASRLLNILLKDQMSAFEKFREGRPVASICRDILRKREETVTWNAPKAVIKHRCPVEVDEYIKEHRVKRNVFYTCAILRNFH